MVDANTSFGALTPRSVRPYRDETSHSIMDVQPHRSRLVILKDNLPRQYFEVLVALCLLYVGSVFPYRLCFWEFHIPEPEDDSRLLSTIEAVIDVIFMIDLVVSFFMSYEDRTGKEIIDLRAIAMNYLQGWFWVNLLSCVPPELVSLLLGNWIEDGPALTKSLRLGRVAKISRLVRLTRMVRLMRVISSLLKSSAIQKMRQGRGVLFFNFVIALLWVVHLMACGWYLCAALHSDPDRTWVGRRNILNDDDTLLEASPFEQWLHAMYFVLTVFTTVGFGDIHAVTNGEILYACVTMMVGAVVHSIAVSEMINLVMKQDQDTIDRARQLELVEGFARNTKLDKSTTKVLQAWASRTTKTTGCAYDRDAMCTLITSNVIPRSIMVQLPDSMFGGELKRNKFIIDCFRGNDQLPPRFPAVVALMLNHRHYMCGDVVYHSLEQAWNLFLVIEGTFANVGKPGPLGGCSPPVQGREDNVAAIVTGRSISFPGIGSVNPTLLTKLRTLSLQKATPQLSNSCQGFYPYQIFGRDTYFGDTEIFENAERHSSVRCESSHNGSLLVLHKKDFQQILEDFPSFRYVWLINAKHREVRRKLLLRRFVVGKKLKHFAATVIQEHFRSHQPFRKVVPTTMTSPTASEHSSTGCDSTVQLLRSLPTDIPRLEHPWRPATVAGTGCAAQDDTVAALRRDVDSLRSEMRAGFAQMQLCMQGARVGAHSSSPV